MKHTPRKWRVYRNKEGQRFIITNGGESPKNSDCKASYIDTEANARLIAASPDLLETLKTVREFIRTARQYFPKSIQNSDKFDLENTCAAVNSAIAKVEGRE